MGVKPVETGCGVSIIKLCGKLKKPRNVIEEEKMLKSLYSEKSAHDIISRRRFKNF
jgi:hypothetical protein